MNHVRERMGEASREPPRYRTAAEVQELLGEAAEVEALDVTADYAGFEDYWASLLGGAGPLGEWVASLDGARRETARTELMRELGDPRAVHARGSLLGREARLVTRELSIA